MEVALPDVSQSFQKTKGFLTSQVGKAVNSVSEATAEAKSSLSESASQAKEALTQTTNSAVNTVNQATNNALGTVADKTEKARISISEVANQAVSRVSESTNKAVDAVSHSAATAKETINQTTNSAVNTLNQSTSQAVESVNQATEKAKASLEKAGNMSGAASDALQSAINGTVKDWIDSHPVVFWLVSHPLISLAMLLLFIFIILGFFQGLSSFFAKGWLFILQSSVKFMQRVLSVGSKSITNVGGVAVNSLVSKNPEYKNNSALQLRGVESNSLESQERLANILTRLEAIRQEQNQLLQEASAILGNKFKAE
jgi:DNA anti-recombination protein RmuC